MNAYELRDILVSLWSPILVTERDFHIDIGELKWYSTDYSGLVLDETTSEKKWKKYFKSKGIRVIPNWAFNLPLLVISPEEDTELKRTFLHTAIHEYAHLIREKMLIIYPKTLQGNDYEKEQFMSDFMSAVFPEEERNVEPLFGNYAPTWLQYDINHDPLFYFIFYVLERKAEDIGLFKKGYEPEISTTWGQTL